MLLPTKIVENFIDSNELDFVVKKIYENSSEIVDDLSVYNDTGNGGRHANKVISTNYFWDYHKTLEVEKILTPKIKKIFDQNFEIVESHILNSKVPYLIHTDTIRLSDKNRIPGYTILIPCDTFDTNTVCFNEYHNTSNDFEDFKKNYQGDLNLKIDFEICAKYLSHVHPNDLKYLTLQEIFPWKKGTAFFMDRKYFHCSDNFVKRGLQSKQCIVLWTVS